MKTVVVTAIGLLAWCLAGSAQTNVAPFGGGPIYSLDQFGPVTTPKETFAKATADILAAGGGVLIIPANTPPSWNPPASPQSIFRIPEVPAPAKSWGKKAGVTVVDARGGTLKVNPAQVTGMEMNRKLDLSGEQSLPFWDYFPMLKLRNTVLHGSTSYRDWLQEAAPAGKDSKFYVATIRGIFPGMFMSIGEYGTVERLFVKSVGYDKEKGMWYFVADTEHGQPKGTIMGNKNHVNVLDMQTTSHNENQTFDVRMWRYNYSQGDNYLFDARFKYMGDVHSTAGDENGVLYAAFVEPLLNIFRGEVTSWDSGTHDLKFKPTVSATLGTGRPLINLNPAKWITNGTVVICQPASWIDYMSPNLVEKVYQGKTYPTTLTKNKLNNKVLRMGGLIRFSAAAPITDEVVGRYFAVDDPSEYVPPSGPAAPIRRWFLIDSLTNNADGTKDITIIRHWWGAKSAGSPTLYKPANATYDGHVKPLRYVIAPGANVYDVSKAVNHPATTLKVVPGPFTGTAADFAPGDRVEQAIGSDPFKPIPFRAWMWDAIPGAFPAPVFDVSNNGHVQRQTALHIRGGTRGSLTKDLENRYDQQAPWNEMITLDSTANNAIKFACDVANSAILFMQPNNREQPIKWHYGTETNQPDRVASLTVSRATGDFNFSGGLVTTGGLSGGDKPARNLRGMNIAIPAGAQEFQVKFATAEADAQYAVFIEQNWIGQRAIVNKQAQGFTVKFEKPAPADAMFDWMIIR
ncbi:MAG: hypothetical protein PCFJNLEI_00489 [Verrucomicrobiae bacterium]|nr:hypothetical protein [Verrucomicrobiae bacterium]